MAVAELKLLAALPADLRLEASRARGRFHLDVAGWFAAMEHPEALPRLSRAIREQCAIHMRYRAHLPIGSSHGACLELLRLGAEVEVLAPTALRAQMAATIAALARVYGS